MFTPSLYVIHFKRALNSGEAQGMSESEREFVGVREAVALVKAMRDEGLRIFLNADHTHSLEKAEEAARAGFDMVVFDASEKPIEENINLTQRAVEDEVHQRRNPG